VQPVVSLREWRARGVLPVCLRVNRHVCVLRGLDQRWQCVPTGASGYEVMGLSLQEQREGGANACKRNILR
jgi:hypothetical protein